MSHHQQPQVIISQEQMQKIQQLKQLQQLQDQIKQQQQPTATATIMYANNDSSVVTVSVPVTDHVSNINNNELMNIAFERDPDDPIVVVIKDIVFNLILNIPGLRTKLTALLDTPNLVLDEINKIFNELKQKISNQDIDNLRKYIGTETSRSSLLSILQTAFQNILADGKIDMNDTADFLKLIHDVVSLFNESSKTQNIQVTVSGEIIMEFLYFLLKCVLVLTLNDPEEAIALRLLDTSFKLLSITVSPLMKMKCSLFSCCRK
jgi:hypothetical protein